MNGNVGLPNAMARKLVSPNRHDSGKLPESKSDNESSKALINRRKYLTLGATVTATLLGSGSAYSVAGAPDDSENTYWTDFSEASL